MKFDQKFGGPFRPKFGHKHEILARFQTSLQLDRNYLRNATRLRQLENDVANYGQSRLNLVYFGTQVVKNRTGVLTHPLAIVQRTGINKSVAFAGWQQRAAIRLGSATHSNLDDISYHVVIL